MGYLSMTDADRAEMLAAIGVSSVDELFRSILRLSRRAQREDGAAPEPSSADVPRE